MDDGDAVDRAWALMRKIGYCMLCTHDGAQIRARPMAAHVDRTRHTIAFLTDVANHTDDEIASEPHVCLAFADPHDQKYVAVTGRAVISNERARIKELWSMRIGALFLIVGLAAYPFARNLWALAVIIPLIPIGTALLFPATTALLSKATDAADYGTALGTAQTFAGVSRLIAPLVSTALFGYLSPNLPFFVAAEIAALGCLLTFRIQSPRLKPAPVAVMVDFSSR